MLKVVEVDRVSGVADVKPAYVIRLISSPPITKPRPHYICRIFGLKIGAQSLRKYTLVKANISDIYCDELMTLM